MEASQSSVPDVTAVNGLVVMPAVTAGKPGEWSPSRGYAAPASAKDRNGTGNRARNLLTRAYCRRVPGGSTDDAVRLRRRIGVSPGPGAHGGQGRRDQRPGPRAVRRNDAGRPRRGSGQPPASRLRQADARGPVDL